MENGFDEHVNGAAPKQVMENIVTVKVQTKQEMSTQTGRFTFTVIESFEAVTTLSMMHIKMLYVTMMLYDKG